jgi:hypothetical protein
MKFGSSIILAQVAMIMLMPYAALAGEGGTRWGGRYKQKSANHSEEGRSVVQQVSEIDGKTLLGRCVSTFCCCVLYLMLEDHRI